MCHPTSSIALSSAQMLDSEGRCKCLDVAAGGFVRSEASLGIHTAAAAQEENSGQCIVIRSCVINQDGRSSALTAPNGPAQQEAIRSAGNSQHVTGLQMHGTGTALGDPIEVGAAVAVA